MSDVILLYDCDCPNVEDCRANLIKAFAASGRTPSWREFDRSSQHLPRPFRAFGSPTILVDGIDVAGELPGDSGATCRLYVDEKGGLAGIPSVELLTRVLQREGVSNGSWKGTLAVLPAIGTAMIPGISCPACWPGYAALLSSFGIGFLPSNRYLLPITVALLAGYLAMLGWDARQRNKYGALLVGIAGSITLLAGRFGLESTSVFFVGILLLVSASVWNAWPAIRSRWFATRQRTAGCSVCQSATEINVTEPL